VQSWPLERPEPGSRSTAGCCCPARGLSTVGLLEWPRALRRRGFIGDHSDAIRLRTPDGLCRLIGRRACVEDHLRPVTGGTDRSRCRRLGSPQSSREVPAETQEEPAGTGRGTGTQRKGSVVGGPETSGGSPGTGGPVWPLEVPVRGAVAHRLRPVGISAQARSVTAGAGLAFRVPGTLIGRPSPNQRMRVVYRRLT
jgi:hypothetical protein